MQGTHLLNVGLLSQNLLGLKETQTLLLFLLLIRLKLNYKIMN